MKKIRLIVVILMVLCMSSVIWAEQITKIGIVDLSRVTAAYYKESKTVRDFEQKKTQFQTEIDTINKEIQTLRDKKSQAEKDGNQSQALEIEKKINERKKYLKDFKDMKEKQLTELSESLKGTSNFYRDAYDAIKYVAESEGFSIIMRIDDPNLMFYSKEIDITDLVIKRLSEGDKKTN